MKAAEKEESIIVEENEENHRNVKGGENGAPMSERRRGVKPGRLSSSDIINNSKAYLMA
jgi:hypothetical protein